MFLRTLCVITLFVSAALAGEMGRPLAQPFPPNLYERSDQLWSVVQDARGVMYFGCFSVTVTYDGYSYTNALERRIREHQSWYREGGQNWLVRTDITVFADALGQAPR